VTARAAGHVNLASVHLLAQDAGEGQPIRFAVGEVQIDLAVVARREGGSKAGIQFGVVAVGAHGGVSREETHRLTMTLQPRDPETGRRRNSARDLDDDGRSETQPADALNTSHTMIK
jgi:NTP-dependent ternary system trypsin peptidase co-occuring protein